MQYDHVVRQPSVPAVNAFDMKKLVRAFSANLLESLLLFNHPPFIVELEPTVAYFDMHLGAV